MKRGSWPSGPWRSSRNAAGFRTSTRKIHGNRKWQKAWPPSPGTAHRKRQQKRAQSLTMPDLSDDELLDALGVDATPERVGSHTPREERIIAGFEDILRFFDKHGRAP